MKSENLISSIEKNVRYQIKKVNALFQKRHNTNVKYLNEYLNPGQRLDEENAILNQALSDALLNSMASLIDYYSICCMLKLGVTEEKIKKVQYRPLSNSVIVEKASASKSEKVSTTIDTILKQYAEATKEKKNFKSLVGHDYWIGFLGKAISHTLKEYGALEDSTFELAYDEENDRIKVNPKVEQYYFYMRPLLCNAASSMGLKHNIYIDINNFLKHNAVPYLTNNIEKFTNEERIFSYFEVRNDHSSLLKEGVLKDLLLSDFLDLKDSLKSKRTNKEDSEFLCPLEKKWGLGQVLTLDPVNSYIGPNDDILYFYIGGVLVAKTKTALWVDADKSFFSAFQELRREIDIGLNIKF
jgi:hypothetical protein